MGWAVAVSVLAILLSVGLGKAADTNSADKPSEQSDSKSQAKPDKPDGKAAIDSQVVGTPSSSTRAAFERAMEAGLAKSQSDAVRKGLERLGKSAERLLRKIA